MDYSNERAEKILQKLIMPEEKYCLSYDSKTEYTGTELRENFTVEEIIGFLHIGYLETDYFDESDAEEIDQLAEGLIARSKRK